MPSACFLVMLLSCFMSGRPELFVHLQRNTSHEGLVQLILLHASWIIICELHSCKPSHNELTTTGGMTWTQMRLKAHMVCTDHSMI